MYERGEDHLPTGRLVRPATESRDDCFIEPLANPVVVVNDTAMTLRSDCSHWVIYDGDPDGICLEPQSGPPNAPNDAPFILEAGATLHRWFEICW